MSQDLKYTSIVSYQVLFKMNPADAQSPHFEIPVVIKII